MMKKKKERPFIKRLFMAPLQIGVQVTKKLMNKIPEPGTLILVRHGESEWNANKTFTVSTVALLSCVSMPILYASIILIFFYEIL